MLFEKFIKLLRPESTSEIQKSHFLKLIGVGILFLFGASVFVLNFWNADERYSSSSTDEEKATSIESATTHTSLNEAWRHKIEENFDAFRKSHDALESKIDLNQSQTAELMKMMTEKGLNEDSSTQTQLNNMDTRLLEIEQKLETLHTPSSSSGSPDGSEGDKTGQIQKFTLNLTQNPKHKAIKNIKNTLPTGAFVKAILLSGLDASSSMNASSDPRPMLLRLLDPGVLPRRFKSDLKDCHCTASAYGDLSSERVYARLEKLSCTEVATGNIIETQVAGFIAGADGRAGIRGVVVSKDGQFLGRSLLGGVFAGLSNVANPQNREAQVNPFFAGNPKIEAPSMGKMFSSGMAMGATSALDRLSQYYIDRAEQLQPVIQVSAGQEVDIVFTEGIAFGSENVKEKIEAERSSNKTQVAAAAPSLHTPQNEENQE